MLNAAEVPMTTYRTGLVTRLSGAGLVAVLLLIGLAACVAHADAGHDADMPEHDLCAGIAAIEVPVEFNGLLVALDRERPDAASDPRVVCTLAPDPPPKSVSASF